MKQGESGKGNDFIRTYVRLKPTQMDELSLINYTSNEVVVQKHSCDTFEYSTS